MDAPLVSNDYDCVYKTPHANHVQKRVHGSVTNLRSYKKRRISGASFDFAGGLDENAVPGNSAHSGGTIYIESSQSFSPLNITPRTRRISKQFGFVDERVLNFKDDTNLFTSKHNDDSTMTLLRRSASSLFYDTRPARPTSVTENLSKRRNSLIVLDSPGLSFDPEAYPITWSRQNLISVACYNDVYYQNLNNKSVSVLCSAVPPGRIGGIQWGDEKHENYLAMGTTSGLLQVWDAGAKGGRGVLQHTWRANDEGSFKSLSWNFDVLAAGTEDGRIILNDMRESRQSTSLQKHKSRVISLQWSTNRNHLASGDKDGVVHIWDQRMGKPLVPMSLKMRHKGSTKALAWCPWKPELLATGSAAPEGKIRIWNTSSMASHAPEPVHIIPLNTSVLSLQWSPHCKELLSTHGSSFAPLLSARKSTSASSHNGNNPTNTTEKRLTYTKTPLTNSITVHEYPSCKRLMTLTNAHAGAVTHSCLSPNGESIFTVCPHEETIKMWQVWSERPPVPKGESAFDKYVIR
ncbi:WD40-repeat-containing domain protein [Gymnopilus junonius]|uniref:WD40-repeat-containing domain protein n=1 Tax=Gymnopilus junonius TaxID=109634 RepID=A0A9P5NNN9_GYMJU|nr:WD40-repeat-containing domain protein [Gymnopilus junonius]